MKKVSKGLAVVILGVAITVLTVFAGVYLINEYKYTNEEFIQMLDETEGFADGMYEQAESYQLISNLSQSKSNLLAITPQVESISDNYYEKVKKVREDNGAKLTEEQKEALKDLEYSSYELSESMSMLHKGLSTNNSDLIYEAGEKFEDSKSYLKKSLKFFEEEL